MSLAKSFMHHLTSIELLCIHNYDVYTKLFSQKEFGTTPLGVACIYNYDVYTILLSQDEFASTPLRVACGENHPKVVTVLIENGAVVDSTNKVFQNSIVL